MRGSAGHQDMIIVTPVNAERAAIQHDISFSVGQTPANGGDQSRTSAGAAGMGFARISFPHAHAKFRRAAHLDKFDIDLVREKLIGFKTRTDFLNVQLFYVIDKEHGMRIADIDAHWLRP